MARKLRSSHLAKATRIRYNHDSSSKSVINDLDEKKMISWIITSMLKMSFKIKSLIKYPAAQCLRVYFAPSTHQCAPKVSNEDYGFIVKPLTS